jgi:hypothetical protein
MWRDIMEKNCPKAMADMVKYCEHDVLLLERIYKRMEAYGRPKSNAAVLDGNHRWGCPYCGSTKVRKSKTITTAAGSVQHQMFCRDHDTRRYYTISNLKYKEYQEDRFEAQRASVD